MTTASTPTLQRSRRVDGRRRLGFLLIGTATSAQATPFRRTPQRCHRRLAMTCQLPMRQAALSIRGGSSDLPQEEESDDDLGILSSPFLDAFQEEVHEIVSDYRAEVRRTFRELRMHMQPDSSADAGVSYSRGDEEEYNRPNSLGSSHEEESDTFSDFRDDEQDVEFVMGDTDEEEDHVLDRLSANEDQYTSEDAVRNIDEEDHGLDHFTSADARDSEAEGEGHEQDGDLESPGDESGASQDEDMTQSSVSADADEAPENSPSTVDGLLNDEEAVPKKKKRKSKGKKKKKKNVSFKDEPSLSGQDEAAFEVERDRDSAFSLVDAPAQVPATESQLQLGKSVVLAFTAAVFFILINLAVRILLKALSRAPG